MKAIFLAFVLAANLAPSIALARAGTLVRCDMLQTQQGIRYVGTYCVDYQCSYTTTRVFMSYCPYSI